MIPMIPELFASGVLQCPFCEVCQVNVLDDMRYELCWGSMIPWLVDVDIQARLNICIRGRLEARPLMNTHDFSNSEFSRSGWVVVCMLTRLA